MRVASIAFVFGLGLSLPAYAAQTIVGEWKIPGHDCSPVAGSIVIEPMGIRADELSCDFKDVGRVGDVVTWHGACDNGGEAWKAKVVARLEGRRLAVSFNGDKVDVYERCR